jgi:hypothetical protein
MYRHSTEGLSSISAQSVVRLRNAIAHYLPEDVTADEANKMERWIKGKFADNRLMQGVQQRLVARPLSRPRVRGVGSPLGSRASGRSVRSTRDQAPLSGASRGQGLVRVGAPPWQVAGQVLSRSRAAAVQHVVRRSLSLLTA